MTMYVCCKFFSGQSFDTHRKTFALSTRACHVSLAGYPIGRGQMAIVAAMSPHRPHASPPRVTGGDHIGCGQTAAVAAVASMRGRPRGTAVTRSVSARTGVTTTTTAAAASTSSINEEKRANYERIVGKNAPTDTLLTFAYGANLSAERLRSRGISPTASLVARAPGYELRFQHRGGYASLDPIGVDDERDDDDEEEEDGGGAYGVVHRISRSELALIKRWEIGYEMKELGVMIRAIENAGVKEGEEEEEEEEEEKEMRVMATVFVTKQSARLRRPVPPFREYHDRILDGARVVGLPSSYVDRLIALGEGAVPKAQRGEEYFDLQGDISGDGLVVGAVTAAAGVAAFALACCFAFVVVGAVR